MKKIYLSIIAVCISFCMQAQTLNGITPNVGVVGQENLSTTITGTNLFQVTGSPSGNIYDINLRQGPNTIPVFDFNTFDYFNPNINLLDPNTMTATFSIPHNAVTGTYDLTLTTTDPWAPGSNLVPYTVVGAFTVNPPDGYISGKIYFDLNENGVYDVGEPGIPNEIVTIQPSGSIVRTDINGDYSFAVMNGNTTVSRQNNLSHVYLLSSDSASFSVNMNSANVGGKDFGLVDGITAISPGVGYQGLVINAIISTRSLFAGGATINYGRIILTSSPFNNYSFNALSFTILDSMNVQLVYQIPIGVPLGTYDLTIVLNNNFTYYLKSALVVYPPPSILNGHCYFDSNNNGAFDSGEPPISSARLALSPEGALAFSNISGDFQFGATLGSHVLSYNSLTLSGLTLTTQPSYTFTNSGNQGGFDFGFRSSLTDYTCSVYFSNGTPRCNSIVTSNITIANLSNVVCQGLVYLVHSANTTYSSSSPMYTSMSGDTIFWSFTSLQPRQNESVSVSFNYPPVGATVQFTSGVQVVDGSGIQQFQLARNYSESVRCSWDPNDKAVEPQGVDDVMHYTLNSSPLEYLIRFQNTGNDTAFTVYIRDTIDASLDINTLEILASSHSVQTEVDSNRAVVFMFSNILLADSVIDEPHSHGYVSYRISPLAGIPDPTVVENTAYIYFDFNPAVVTNTTWNTLVQMIPVGISESIQVGDGVFFYPNPMESIGYLSFSNSKSEPMLMELFDIKGQKVSAQETNGSILEINRNKLSSGLYLFRLVNKTSGIVNTGKISIR